MISGRDFLPGSDVGSKLIQYTDLHINPFTGFTLLFPLKNHGEDGIGGRIYQCKSLFLLSARHFTGTSLGEVCIV
jgi:hypothetical protein